MIESFSLLWSIMTAFFNTVVIYEPLFMALLLFNLIFGVIYLFKYIYDFVSHGVY